MFIGLVAKPINNLGGLFRIATENGHIGSALILVKWRDMSDVQGERSLFGVWFTADEVL
jgi:hypothetical protein